MYINGRRPVGKESERYAGSYDVMKLAKNKVIIQI